tara:strand:+ start:206 stop:826 length:621 start_codon:yes stop_codon:yes gene_type:complete
MNVGLNAAQARTKANADLVLFDEVQFIMKAIISASTAGNYTATISDGTTMTESTPSVTITGTQAAPTVAVGETFIFEGNTVTLGTSGTNLNAIIADINDAGITGLVASKNASNNIVLTYDIPAATSFLYVIGAGTANNNLGITAQTYTAPNPTSNAYWTCWMGTSTDRGKKTQMDYIVKHFSNLGYRIERSTNTSTNATFQWNIDW